MRDCQEGADEKRREGTARITLFAAQGNAQTFDYQAGDIAYIPTGWGESQLCLRGLCVRLLLTPRCVT